VNENKNTMEIEEDIKNKPKKESEVKELIRIVNEPPK